MTAGHNALRGSGPGHKPAFKNAMAQVGCPDRRNDRVLHYVLFALPTFTSRHGTRRECSSDPQPERIIVSLTPSHHCPGYSREFVGKGDGSDFGRPSCQQRCDPRPILGAVDLALVPDDGECAGHEQAAQITVPLFADATEPVPTPARVLFGYQPDPGREVPTRSESFRIGDACNQCRGQQ